MTAIKLTGQPEKISDIIEGIKNSNVSAAQKRRARTRRAVSQTVHYARVGGYRIDKNPKVKIVRMGLGGRKERVIETLWQAKLIRIDRVLDALERQGAIAKKPGELALERAFNTPAGPPTKPKEAQTTLNEFMHKGNARNREAWLELVALGVPVISIYTQFDKAPSIEQIKNWRQKSLAFRDACDRVLRVSAETFELKIGEILFAAKDSIMVDLPDLGRLPSQVLWNAQKAAIYRCRMEMHLRDPSRYPDPGNPPQRQGGSVFGLGAQWAFANA